ncbi:MAG: potassium ABC transporter ATPase [Burkholderiales bacterium]|nr:potassium ABC transporter ATPase [Burkholderiales bacterium]
MELFYIGLIAGFFALSVLLVYGCEKLGRPS